MENGTLHMRNSFFFKMQFFCWLKTFVGESVVFSRRFFVGTDSFLVVFKEKVQFLCIF